MSELEEKVIAGAKTVYTELGTGYSESVYHRAMEVECRRRGIRYETKAIVPILYAGYCVGYGEADLIIFNDEGHPDLIVELKAVTYAPRAQEVSQIKTYLRGRPDIKRGVIINFRQPTLASGDDLKVDTLSVL